MYVYAYYNTEQEIIYVGSSTNVVARFRNHKCTDHWMKHVAGIRVWGPYDCSTGLLCEKALISKTNPCYNINMAYGHDDTDAPILHESGIMFAGYDKMKAYFSTLPKELVNCTFHLPIEDMEALRSLAFYSAQNISELVQEILHEAILKRATQLNVPHIYEEVYTILAKKQTRKL